MVAQGDAILVKDLPPEIRGIAEAAAAPALTLDAALDFVLDQPRPSEPPLMAQIEREIVQRALKAADGDEAAAAKRLGLSKAALRKRL